MAELRKILGLAIISSLVSKTSGLAYQIISIPIIVKMLGKADFGLFLAYTGFSTWLSLLSLGIAPTIISLAADKKRNNELPNAYFMSTLILISMFFIVGIFFAIIKPLLSHHSVVFSPQNSNLFWCAYIIFSITISLSISDAINQGQERQHINNLNFSASNIINMSAIFLLSKYLTNETVTYVFFISQIGFIAGKIFNTGLVLRRVGMKFKILSLEFIKSFVRNSGSFLFMQMAVLISQQAIVILCLEKIGSTISGELSLVFRAYALLGSVITMISQPLWPILKTALTESRHEWIESVFKKLYLTYFLYGMFIIGLSATYGAVIFRLWTSGTYNLSFATCILIGIHFLLITLAQSCVVLLMGLGAFYQLAKVLILEAIIGFSFVYISLIFHGKGLQLTEILIELIVANLITSFWMLPIKAKSILNDTKK